MTQRDMLGLVASYAYAFGLLAVAELVRRRFRLGQDFTRKLVHVGAGMWIFGVLALFDTWYIGIIPFATFILLNFLIYRFRLLRSIEIEESSPGTVYFAASITILFLLFWPRGMPIVAAAGSMAMTWGDAFAAIVGRKLGRRYYKVWGEQKSVEGSLAMATFSFVAILLTFLLMAPDLGIARILLTSLLSALVAACVEAISPRGLDNLSVPLAVGIAAWLLLY